MRGSSRVARENHACRVAFCGLLTPTLGRARSAHSSASCQLFGDGGAAPRGRRRGEGEVPACLSAWRTSLARNAPPFGPSYKHTSLPQKLSDTRLLSLANGLLRSGKGVPDGKFGRSAEADGDRKRRAKAVLFRTLFPVPFLNSCELFRLNCTVPRLPHEQNTEIPTFGGKH